MKLRYTAHVPKGDGPHPAIVLLHGWGASSHDLLGLAPLLHGGEALVICPEGPLELEIGPGMVGHGWFPLSPEAPPDPAAIDDARLTLEAFIEAACEKFPIDQRKLVLAGFSQGGFMAYQIALRDPAKYAGLMALSSWLPGELAGSLISQPGHAQLPALVIHGLNDPMIDIERGRASRDALETLGVPTTYHEFPMEHEIAREALIEVVTWLEERPWGASSILSLV